MFKNNSINQIIFIYNVKWLHLRCLPMLYLLANVLELLYLCVPNLIIFKTDIAVDFYQSHS